MNVFENFSDYAKSLLKGWVRIEDKKNPWTIESFAKINYDESKIGPHCVFCTIINKCWFKDEENKRPPEFNYSGYSEEDTPQISRGLYHPYCHDKKYAIDAPTQNKIEIFDLERRMDYLFNKKKNWLESMGYNENDKQEVFQLIEKLSKDSYCKSDYQNNPPTEEKKKYGFRIRIRLLFPGKGEKEGKIYPLTSSYIVYPNGMLKNNTPIGGRSK